MRIGVVGDIHGNLNVLERVLRVMGPVDQLLFTGDGYRELARVKLSFRFPIKGVAGNCDFITEYPVEQIFQLESHQVMLTHGHRYGVKQGLTTIGLAGRERGVGLIIFGHTHLPLNTEWEGIKLFNPGTLCPERAYRGVTYGVIEIDQDRIRFFHERL
ncbi:MAG: metallophosphoesterase family protein [Bacteroidota bacterium]